MNLFGGLILVNCIGFRCNVMFFKVIISRISAIFYNVFNFMNIFQFYFFPAPGAQGPPPRFDNKLLRSF